MLNDSERNRRADLITEFYKGFLLAVDSLRHSDKPIHIQTYDTEGDAATPALHHGCARSWQRHR